MKYFLYFLTIFLAGLAKKRYICSKLLNHLTKNDNDENAI